MTKNDLENGMIVKTRDGGKYLVMNNYLLNENGDTYLERMCYENDLTDEDDPGFDVIAIYRSNADVLNDLFDDSELEPIWYRQSFKYGDKVKVINTSESYTTNLQWFEKHEDKFDIETLLKFRYGEHPIHDEDLIYTVIFADYDEEKVLITNGTSVYLMSMKGVKKVDEHKRKRKVNQ